MKHSVKIQISGSDDWGRVNLEPYLKRGIDEFLKDNSDKTVRIIFMQRKERSKPNRKESPVAEATNLVEPA